MTTTSPFDTKAQDRALHDKAEREKALLMQERTDWQWVMSTEYGRRIVRNLLEICGVYRTSFTGDAETFFKEGQRIIGLTILAKVHSHAPDQSLAMLKEAAPNV